MSSQPSLEIMASPHAGLAATDGAVIQSARDAFDALGTLLSDALDPFRKKLGEITSSADEVELKLDLALKGGAKWVVVSAEVGATVSVKLVWRGKQ